METFELYSVPAFSSGSPEAVPGLAVGSTKQLVRPGDVLVCKINPRINRVWQVQKQTTARQIASSEWIGFRVPGQHARYYRYYFSSPAFRNLICTDLTGVGGSLTRAQPKRVAGFSVPVAPLAEQHRIADKLDTVLARVDACRDRLARVAPLLKRFRQSVLATALSGQLTTEAHGSVHPRWLEEPSVALRNCCDLDVGYAFKSAEFEGKGVRLLRGDNIEPGRLRWIDAKHFPPSKLNELRNLFLEEGNVVLAMDRPIISSGLKLARVSASDLPAVLVQRVCRFKPRATLLEDFLFCLLRSAAFIDHLSSKQNGSSIPHISGGQILDFCFRLPPLQAQREIVRRVETLFSYADRLEARLAAAQSAVDRLAPALLAKAFRGELVPQDPADEPASELLRRLAQSRSTPAPKPRKRQTA